MNNNTYPPYQGTKTLDEYFATWMGNKEELSAYLDELIEEDDPTLFKVFIKKYNRFLKTQIEKEKEAQPND